MLQTFIAIWASIITTEQMCILLLAYFKSEKIVPTLISFFIIVCVVSASGTLKPYNSLPLWFKTYVCTYLPTKYSCSLLFNVIFLKLDCVGNCLDLETFIIERIDVIDEQTSVLVLLSWILGLMLMNIMLSATFLPKTSK